MTEQRAQPARTAVYSELMWPKWNPTSESHGAGEEKTNALLDAFRAEILREAADLLDESDNLRDLTDDHMHDVNAAANELRRMATEETTA